MLINNNSYKRLLIPFVGVSYILKELSMRKYIYISIGGALGAVLRLTIINKNFLDYSVNFPINTLIINITGCFILALFLTIAFGVMNLNIDIQHGVATGLMGAYTTFSTLCKETSILINGGEYSLALIYITLSILLGLLAVFLGIILARKMISLLYIDKRIENQVKIIDRNEVE